MRPLLRPLAFSFALVATPVALVAQVAAAAPGRPYQFTIEDYARAERFLGATSAPLVSGQAGHQNWIGTAGRFWYRTANVGGTASFWLVDPARKSRVPAFDHPKLATALSTATGTREWTGIACPSPRSRSRRTSSPSPRRCAAPAGAATSWPTPALTPVARPHRSRTRAPLRLTGRGSSSGARTTSTHGGPMVRAPRSRSPPTASPTSATRRTTPDGRTARTRSSPGHRTASGSRPSSMTAAVCAR